MLRILVVLGVLPILAGCLPSSGPGRSAIINEAYHEAPDYSVVALNQGVADVLASNDDLSLAGTFGMGGGAPTLTLGVGDVVVVTIFEAAAGGLFTSPTGSIGGNKSVSMPPQPVSRAGTLSIPYVGQVRAAGLLPSQVEQAIVEALRDKAIEPQALVTVSQSPSNAVTVAGEVVRTGPIPLNPGGDRLLDVISAAGGSRAPDYETFVRLTRDARSANISLARIVRDPRENIFVRPDDLIYVYRDPQVFTVFGATGANFSFDFRADRLTLAEALGRGGGLSDFRANPRGVFVFRYEDPAAFMQINRSVSAPPPAPAGIPVVYTLDLKEPSGYFIAQRFLMRDNDILYVSNAPAAELQKALTIITGGLGTATTARTTADVLTNADN
jgi:polysaccharide export outer membrane protein